VSGSMPTEIGMLRSLEYLQLDYNKVAGRISAEAGVLTTAFLDTREQVAGGHWLAEAPAFAESFYSFSRYKHASRHDSPRDVFLKI
jgi:hypothetical protein